MDNLTPQRRSWNMGRIKSGNTAPELLVRSILHRAGYRFRLHRKDLPGTPDIVLPRLRVAIFVHGCFWHRHLHCKFAYTPKSRAEFWESKFQSNVARDQRTVRELESLGWAVIVVWECDLHDPEALRECLVGQLGVAAQHESRAIPTE